MSIAGDTSPRIPGFNSYSETVLSPRRSGIAWQVATNPGNATVPTASGSGSIAIGPGSATGIGSIVIGSGTSANSTSIAIGPAAVFGTNSIGIGAATAGVSNNIGNENIAIGNGAICAINASVGSAGSVCIGLNARTSSALNAVNTGNSTAVGTSALAVADNSTGIGRSANALAASSTALGHSSTVNTGATSSTAVGSSATVATNATSAVALGASASAGGNNAVAIRGTATPADSIAIRGTVNTGATNSIAIGVSSSVSTSATSAIAIGDSAVTASVNSQAIGALANTEFQGQINLCNARFATNNDIATSTVPMYMTTTTAAATNLATGAGAAATTPTGTLVCTNNSTYIFEVDIVAKSASNAGAAAWNLKFAFDRQGSAATSEISALSKTIMYTRGTTTGWDVTATADTTNGRPNITVTGAAATTIRWVGNVKMTKVAH